MCASSVYFRDKDNEEPILEEFVLLKPLKIGYHLFGLLGDEKVMENTRVVEINFETHRVVLGPNPNPA